MSENFWLYLNYFLTGVCVALVIKAFYDQFMKNKYEKIARRMFDCGDLKSGSIWQHYRNGKFYSIQIISNDFATGNQWPLTVVYMTDKGYAVYSRPAHEFIRKFKVIDNHINETPTAMSGILCLSSYVLNKIDFPEEGSKWYREFTKPSYEINAAGHHLKCIDVEFAIIHSVTNKKQPCAFVNYYDENGEIKTATLHRFRQEFELHVDRALPCTSLIPLTAKDRHTLHGNMFGMGDILTVNSVQENKVTFEMCHLKATLELDDTRGIYEGEMYAYMGLDLMHTPAKFETKEEEVNE